MPSHQIDVLIDEPIGVIQPQLHGQFAEHLGGCVYGGIWVGEESKIPNQGGIRSDVLTALQKLKIPVLRWPGGCFADDYNWQDGVGPRSNRPRRFNGWWGHDIEDNSFGTDEFLRLCQLLGSQAYLAGNVGSGSPRELKQWVEYCNFPGDTTLARDRARNGHPDPYNVRYWGVGNESWSCGGNMSPEDYAGEYNRYVAFLQTFTRHPTQMPLFFIACGPSGNDLDWTRRFFSKVGTRFGDWRIDGFAAHFYAGTAGTATEYTADQWYQLLHRGMTVEQLIVDQRSAMDETVPGKRAALILDEWGTWHPSTPGKEVNHLWQQNTLRDALLAAMTLDAFHRHADKLVMANIAQVVNVLQAMVLTDGDRMITTPTYHVFNLYQSHQRQTAVRLQIETGEIRFQQGDSVARLPMLSGSASRQGDQLTLSITNPHTAWPVEAYIDFAGRKLRDATVHTLDSGQDIHAHNTIEDPDRVRPVAAQVGGNLPDTLVLPAASVTVIRGTLC